MRVLACDSQPVAEVHQELKQRSKARGWRADRPKIICSNMRPLSNSNSQKWKTPTGRLRVFVCAEHLRSDDLNERLGHPRWQGLLFEGEQP
jgi:hypothetical protein